MKKHAISAILCTAVTATSLAATALTAQAAGLGDALRDKASQLGGGSAAQSTSSSGLGGLAGGSSASSLAGLGALGGLTSSGTASNAAGVITYCMKNNYLNADKAAQVKNQLLGKMGLGQKEEPKDEGYLSGLSGMVTGSDGKSFSLDKVKSSVKEKACDFVLNNAKSLI